MSDDIILYYLARSTAMLGTFAGFATGALAIDQSVVAALACAFLSGVLTVGAVEIEAMRWER